MTRVLPLSDRETLLGSHGSFVGKKRKNRIPFDNEELFFIQMLKILFVCSFWSWIKLFIDDGPLPLINFLFIGF